MSSPHFPELQYYSSSDCLVIYRILVNGVSPLCRDAVGVFYSPSRLGKSATRVPSSIITDHHPWPTGGLERGWSADYSRCNLQPPKDRENNNKALGTMPGNQKKYLRKLEIRGRIETSSLLKSTRIFKSPGDLRRLADTHTSVKSISYKWCERLTKSKIIL